MPTPSPARVHECTVVKNEPIAQDIFALRIASPELARMLEPGQFVDIAVPGNAMSLLRIPLSFAEADAEAGTIDIWYAVVGDNLWLIRNRVRAINIAFQCQVRSRFQHE